MTARPASRALLALPILLAVASLRGSAAWAQESAAPFDAPVVVTSVWDRMTDLLDTNGDGAPDAVGWYRERVTVFPNDGAGRIFPSVSIRVELPQGYAIRQLRPGRLDGDAFEDIAIAYERRIVAYRSYGGGLTLLFEQPLVDEVLDFALADFDGDGLDDVVVVLNGYLSRTTRIQMFRNDGAGRLVLEDDTVFSPLGSAPKGLFIAELNGNALPDFGFFWNGDLWLYPFRTHSLPEPTVIPTPGIENEMPAVGDVDGDGNEDVVLFGWAFTGFGYRVLRRTGPEQFSLEATRIGGPATRLADVDGDGDLDGVCCGGGGSGSDPNVAASSFEIAFNDGEGGFAPAARLPGLGSLRIAGAADLDGDGDVDLVGGRCVYYARGPIREFGRPAIPSASAIPAIPRPFVDVDSDGDLDFHFALDATSANRGDGSFVETRAKLMAPILGRRAVGPGIVGDFDGDGDADLVVEAVHESSGEFLEMRLLRNTGCGALVDGGRAARRRERMVAMADLAADPSLALVFDADGDGALDVVAQERGAAPFRTRVWRNDGTGRFAPIQEILNEELKGAADMNGDAVVDLVTSWPSSPNVGIRAGRGDGTFLDAPYSIGGLESSFAITLADFDDDGDVDMGGVQNPARHRLYALLRNDGSGVFATFVSLAPFVAAPPARTTEPVLVPSDVNADGRLDVILRSTYDTGHPLSAVLIRQGDGLSYAPPVHQVFWAVRAGDVDGDGDDDLLQASFTGTNSDPSARLADRIIRNPRLAPPMAAVRRQFGVGTPGAAGVVPILGLAGGLRPGDAPDFRLSGGRGGAKALLLIGTALDDAVVRGGTRLVAPRWRRDFRLGGAPGAPGEGGLRFLTRPIPPRFAGRTVHFQAVIRDPDAPDGYSFSNAVTATFGGVE